MGATAPSPPPFHHDRKDITMSLPSRSTTAAPLTIAVIGTGMIAKVHVRAARSLGVEVIGILGRTPRRSLQAAEELGLPRGFSSLEELLTARPDVVHICTPNDQHHAQALAVIAAGLAVVCEKPLATDAARAQELADAAERAGVVATVPYVYRYHPVVREIRARIAAGELGRVLTVHGHYLQDWMHDENASSWRVDSEAGGPSRAFADIGSHWCDLVEFVTGERFSSVSAVTDIVHPTRPVGSAASFSAAGSEDDPRSDTEERAAVTTEDTAVATFRTAAGRLGSAVISQVAAGRKNRLWFEVDGSLGSAAFDQENAETAWLGSSTGEARIVRHDPGHGASDQRRLGIVPAGHAQGYVDAFALFFADTYALVRGEEREGVPTFADGARTARIIESVVGSASDSSWHEIG
jgi:predicted dehydrogenase